MLTREEREALGLPAPTNGTEMYLSAVLAQLTRQSPEASAEAEVVPLREPEAPAKPSSNKKQR